MDNANNQMDTLTTKLGQVEQEVLPDPVQNAEMAEMDLETECVMELMESVSDVTNEYVTLRKDLWVTI